MQSDLQARLLAHPRSHTTEPGFAQPPCPRCSAQWGFEVDQFRQGMQVDLIIETGGEPLGAPMEQPARVPVGGWRFQGQAPTRELRSTILRVDPDEWLRWVTAPVEPTTDDDPHR